MRCMSLDEIKGTREVGGGGEISLMYMYARLLGPFR